MLQEPLRIAVFSPFIYPWIVDLREELTTMGHEVRYMTLRNPSPYPWNDLKGDATVFSASKVFGLDYVASPSIIQEFIRFRPDGMILLGCEFLVGLTLFLLSKILGIRQVIVVEENRPLRRLGIPRTLLYFRSRLVRNMYRSAPFLVAESDESRSYLEELGCSGSMIHVRPHGVRTDLFRPVPTTESEVLSEESRKVQDRVKVLFPTALTESKGAEFLIEAVRSLRQEQVVFLIVSLGTYFEKNEEELRAADNVIIYAPKPHRDMVDLYAHSDMVVIPSKFFLDQSGDRSPNSLMEAMSCGKAVIASDVGGVATIVGNAGFLIPPNDPNALVSAIRSLAISRGLRDELGRRARQRAIQTLELREYAELLANFLATSRSAPTA